MLAVGTWLEQYPQMAHRILRGGHDLGNHTMHHLAIAAMDAHGAYAEIAECAHQLRTLTGSIGPGNAVSVFVTCEHVTDVFTAFGAKGTPAEDVLFPKAPPTQFELTDSAILKSGMAILTYRLA